MAKNFASLAFTNEVKLMQEKMGKQKQLCQDGKRRLC